VIKSFRDKDTEKVFLREFTRKFDMKLRRIALRKLTILDAPEVLDDLSIPPGNRLEKLSGDRSGQYSMRINDQWRICFRWRDGDAYDVEVVDYD
jgi:toxin HigB-1